MAVSKRTYEGPPHYLMDLETGFNVVRERTAKMETNKDGTTLLFVAGWNDWEAAALVSLVNSNVKGNMLNDRIVAAKAVELHNAALVTGAKPPPDLLGHVIMSDRGAQVPVEPDEFVPPQGEPEAVGASGVAESTFDPTLPPGANMPVAPRESGVEPAEDDPDPDTGPPPSEALYRAAMNAQPAWGEAGDEAWDEASEPVMRIELGDGESKHSVKGMERSNILLSAPSCEVAIAFRGEVWKLIKMLSLIFGESPDKVVLRLIGERLDYYAEPEIMNRFMRGELP